MALDRTIVEQMAEAARWAPSVHNTQPWLLRGTTDGLRVLADTSRALPVLDPDGRMLAISCGAAVANAEVAAAAAGHRTRTTLLPDGPRGATVAEVAVTGPHEPTAHERHLAGVVPHRRTHRRVHARERVPSAVVERLVGTVEAAGARLVVLGAAERRHLARLLVRAAREQERDPRFLAEVRTWLRAPAGRHDPAPTDGILVGSLGTSPYPVDSLVHRAGQTSPNASPHVVDTVAESTVVVLQTVADTRRDHVLAGVALQRLLLEAAVADVVATFADQATQRPDTRDDLLSLTGDVGRPQLVLRLGRPLVDVRTPPRRPLSAVLDPPVDLTTPPHVGTFAATAPRRD